MLGVLQQITPAGRRIARAAHGGHQRRVGVHGGHESTVRPGHARGAQALGDEGVGQPRPRCALSHVLRLHDHLSPSMLQRTSPRSSMSPRVPR